MRFLVAAAMLFVLGCGPGPGDGGALTEVGLTWRFADGRHCAEAGVLQVQLTPKPPGTLACNPATCLMLCSDGEGGQGVTVAMPAAGGEIDLAALSPQGDPLYRGTLVFDSQVPAAAAVLYFTAGK